jgi:hypothetical protein
VDDTCRSRRQRVLHRNPTLSDSQWLSSLVVHHCGLLTRAKRVSNPRLSGLADSGRQGDLSASSGEGQAGWAVECGVQRDDRFGCRVGAQVVGVRGGERDTDS